MPSANASNIAVLLVDHRPADGDGLRAFLELEPDFDLLGCVFLSQDVFESIRQLSPAVVVLRVGETVFSGVEICLRIRMLQPDTKVVIVSSAFSPGNLMLALEAGVHGYVVAEAGNQAVAKALRAVFVGAMYLSSQITDTLVADYLQRNGADGAGQLKRLSKREREVFQRLVDGESASGIARDLELSPKTVDTYRRRLMRKLDVTSVPALVKLAVKHGVTTTA